VQSDRTFRVASSDPSSGRAAQLGRWAAQRQADQTLQQEVSALRREPNSHDGQNRADVPCKERKWYG